MTNGLPVGLPLLCRRPIKKIIFFHYPRVSPGAAPLTKKPEDSGYEIERSRTRTQSLRYPCPAERETDGIYEVPTNGRVIGADQKKRGLWERDSLVGDFLVTFKR